MNCAAGSYLTIATLERVMFLSSTVTCRCGTPAMLSSIIKLSLDTGETLNNDWYGSQRPMTTS